MIDWLACTLVKSASWLLCRLPPGVAVALGQGLGTVAYWALPGRRRVGLCNVRAAFEGRLAPPQARRIVRRSFQQLGAGILELLRLPVIDQAYVERYITVEPYDIFQRAVTSDRPAILLTGHLGNWELSSIVAALKGHPIVILARAQKNMPRLYKLLVSYRESKGCTVAHKGGAMRRFLAAMDEGRPVGIAGDQASRQGILTDFFGRPALFAKGPFELARSRRALIVPAFIHRVRGPFHRIVVERPIDLSGEAGGDADVVRHGAERFAALLRRHIEEDPGQWLWVHKRWKYTPARRVLVLSDGKLGHLKQSLAIAETLREGHPGLSFEVIDVRYRSRMSRAWCVAWSWLVPRGWGGADCLQATLAPDTARALLSRYADLIISCGASTVPVNYLWARENRAKSLVILNPTPLPLRRFDLVIAPRHDGLPRRRNVVETLGAVSRFRADDFVQAGTRLKTHPNYRADGAPQAAARTRHSDPAAPHPVVAVFLGGDTAHYELTTAFADALIGQVLAACDTVDGRCLVTTSRRTSQAVERLLTERLARHPRCRLLLIASHDSIEGTMEGMLGSADVAVVTGESISMVSEACVSGRHVVVVEPPLRQANRTALTRHQRFLQEMAREGYARMIQVPEVGYMLRRTIQERPPAKRLDEFDTIRQAAERLL